MLSCSVKEPVVLHYLLLTNGICGRMLVYPEVIKFIDMKKHAFFCVLLMKS